eukprot:1159212-Pelagomonas_calceolata.AAC.8
MQEVNTSARAASELCSKINCRGGELNKRKAICVVQQFQNMYHTLRSAVVSTQYSSIYAVQQRLRCTKVSAQCSSVCAVQQCEHVAVLGRLQGVHACPLCRSFTNS